MKTRAVLSRAVRDRLIAANPCDAIPAPRLDRRGLDLPDRAEVWGLLDRMREEGREAWPLLHLIGSTGMRTGEVRGLRWTDIDHDAGVLHVRGQLDRSGVWAAPKTIAGLRTLPMSDRVAAALDEMSRRQSANRIRSVYVFADDRGRAPNAWAAHGAWRRAQIAAWGEARLTVHGLRHLVLSSLVAAGLPLTDTARVAGHNGIATLAAVYAHALADHQRRVRKAFRDAGVG
jgi:integrase